MKQLNVLIHFFPIQPLDSAVELAIGRGRSWLEHNLMRVGRASRPLEVALVTLALHNTHSPLADTAFAVLARNARQEGWSQTRSLYRSRLPSVRKLQAAVVLNTDLK